MSYSCVLLSSKRLITWRISARAGKKTRLHGKFQPGLKLNLRAGTVVFYIYCCIQGILRMRLWIFSKGWNFLSITWGNSTRSTGQKISSRVAQTGLKFQPSSPGWNFLHVIANSVLQGFYRKPGMNFQPVMNRAESSSRAENPHVISP